MIRRREALGGLAGLLLGSRVEAADKIRVVTTTTDLADLTKWVGGDYVDVTSITKGYQDPHYVEPKPSFVLLLNRADLLIVVGLQLEIAWLPPLLVQSRNPRIQPGRPGYLDVSGVVEILERPAGPVSRVQGDIHPLGNPHYWLDPNNGRRIAHAIQNQLSALKPERASYFASRYAEFDRKLTEAEKRWDAVIAPYHGRKVVTYHRTWPNFAKRFGIQVVDYVEPVPGIPPTPRHILSLIERMKREAVRVIWVEPYYDMKIPQRVAQAVGGVAVHLYPSVGGRPDITDYFKLFAVNLEIITTAFKKTDTSS